MSKRSTLGSVQCLDRVQPFSTGGRDHVESTYGQPVEGREPVTDSKKRHGYSYP